MNKRFKFMTVAGFVLALGLVAFGIRQARDAMTLKAPMQR